MKSLRFAAITSVIVVSLFLCAGRHSYAAGAAFGKPGPAAVDTVPIAAVIQPHNPAWNNAVVEFRHMNLRTPLDGFDSRKMSGSFYEKRGAEMHEAVDMLAPRNTPIYAVSDGTIGKLFLSRFGGITVYQYDRSKRFLFYYAHLQRYADGLKDGDPVKRGQVIGFVGTSGNAPPNTPHLHFALGVLKEKGRWWKFDAVDPYEVYSQKPL